MVFYRKYRPQTITELDSVAVRESLSAIISGNDIPHAFLFTGPKGLGKTSTARILAKAVNCVGRSKDAKFTGTAHNSNIEPCNTCDQCVSITNGTNMDVIEIDAASNRGIDEIRDLKDKIRLAPLKAAKKVYIIDEVHMLTTEAFNALLKTLEEPPSHAMFVLCTTEPHKIPATIFSRSFHIAFMQASDQELVRSFRRIADGEKLQVDDEVLLAIARVADGGFRDGAKVMEELSSLAANKVITKELLEKRYKIGSTSQAVTDLTLSLAAGDTKKSLGIISQLVLEGIDIKFVVQQLIATLHQDLLIAAGVTNGTQKAPMPLEEIRSLLLLLTRAHADIKYAVLAQIPLELVVIEWGAYEPLSTKNEQNGKIISPEGASLATLRKQIGAMQKVKAMYGEAEEKKPTEVQSKPRVTLMHYSASEDTKEWTDNLWHHMIAEMKGHNHTLAGVLRGCFLKSYDRKSLVIETSYKFHKDKLSEAKTLQVLEQICRQLTGNPVNVRIELKAN